MYSVLMRMEYAQMVEQKMRFVRYQSKLGCSVADGSARIRWGLNDCIAAVYEWKPIQERYSVKIEPSRCKIQHGTIFYHRQN